MHLLEERLVDVRDAAEALPRQRQVLLLDRLRQLEGALVVQREQVVRHPYVVVAEVGDLAHLRDHRLDRPRAEQVAEHRLVAEVASERTAPRRHERGRRVLPMLAPIADVVGVGNVATVWQRKVRHVFAADARHCAHDLAVLLEDQPRDVLEAPVLEVLHDLHDCFLALADGDEVELVDECVGLA